MKNLVRSTYSFDLDGPGEDPDEAGVRRSILDTINLLGIVAAELPGADGRAINAIRDGFTAAQYVRVRELIDDAIARRRLRHADAAANSEISRNVLAQVDQIERAWRRTDSDIVALIAAAPETFVTGLELNSAERLEAGLL